MCVQNNVSFRGQIPRNEKRLNTIGALVGGPIAAAVLAATTSAGIKEAKADTFMGTIKNSFKMYNQDYKNVFAWIAKDVFRQEKWANNILKLKNTDKRIFAAAYAINSLFMAGCLKMGMDFGSKFKHRND